MKFYNSIGPNPRIVRMFMAEKGIETSDGRNRPDEGRQPQRAAISASNPHGQMPALELDDGTTVCEITAICEYLEDTHPNPPLIGTTPEENAPKRACGRAGSISTSASRWPTASATARACRCSRIACHGARSGRRAEEDRAPTASNGSRRRWRVANIWRQPFHARRYPALRFLDFGGQVGQPLDPANTNLAAWFARVKARPSATA